MPWPSFDAALCVDEAVTVAVQVNGKMRGTIQLPAGADEAAAMAEAQKLDTVQRQLDGKTLRKTIWVKDKLLNLIAG